ncbi:hypothetical protein MRB53_026133 [Persea americana]|uniref:Uncharacterized protein n=1 Tax=Persea americana TaxID=3435 RepID=A0ACC2LHC4_PERAE|nr:hypothetical protein MRB53_026133 [Persea americana]
MWFSTYFFYSLSSSYSLISLLFAFVAKLRPLTFRIIRIFLPLSVYRFVLCEVSSEAIGEWELQALKEPTMERSPTKIWRGSLTGPLRSSGSQ